MPFCSGKTTRTDVKNISRWGEDLSTFETSRSRSVDGIPKPSMGLAIFTDQVVEKGSI